MTDDLTMTGHARRLARDARIFARSIGFESDMLYTARETARIIAELADIVTELAATHERIHREDDLR